MDKAQAIQAFWSSFGIPAYDEQTVPDEDENGNKVVPPYITYNVSTDSLNNPVPLSGSIWYRGTSWTDVTEKAEQIAAYVGARGHTVIRFDGGYLYVTKGSPFYQRVSDTDPMMRRIYINVTAEFISAY